MSDQTPYADPAPATADPRTRRYTYILIAVALRACGLGHRQPPERAQRPRARGQDAAVMSVLTGKASHGPGVDKLVLPGNVQAFYEAPVYARTNGYLKSWATDIGTRVKKGELLAEIETPEVDQELRQAQADLATAEANYQLARTTNERWKGLLATQSVSQQDADQRAGDAAAKLASRQSAAANLARLQELESFKRVVAPFDGVVTQRNTDVGALIVAGQNSGNPLFRVADTHRLRIYASIPQPYASSVKRGQTALLELADHPGKRFTATVANTADALEAISRTLQVELQIDNKDGDLLPGSYAQVYFDVSGNADTLRIPVNAVIFRTDDLQVAVVDAQGKVHLKKITQGRDFGKEVEVLSGVSMEDNLVLNPPDSIADGMQVRVAKPQNTNQAGKATGKS